MYPAHAPQLPPAEGNAPPSRPSGSGKRGGPPEDAPGAQRNVFKPPKRKRLPKACDPCHKSKRRCDGTAPCGNCYFATKDCTYTDSAGRPVPAPNAARTGAANPPPQNQHSHGLSIALPAEILGPYAPPEEHHTLAEPQHSPSVLALQIDAAGPSHFGSSSAPFASPIHVSPVDTRARPPLQPGAAEPLSAPRKRLRSDSEIYEREQVYTSQTQIPTPVSASRPPSSFATAARGNGRSHAMLADRDRIHLVHELVNLFFAHCHPYRMIIHSTTFFADLFHNRVPSYLLDAMCALAAPLSKNPLLRVSPIREAGKQFEEAALAALFDHDILVAKGVEAAQALVLLQAYKIMSAGSMAGDLMYFVHAFQILYPLLHPSFSTDLSDQEQQSAEIRRAKAVERECMRRTFWLIHMLELLGAIFTRRKTTYKRDELESFPLPCDEATFDLAMIPFSSEQVESLDSPALKSRYTSEFGHVIRIATILLDIEQNNLESPDPHAIADCEERLEEWVLSLADHLQYSTQNLHFQLSMWETSANSTMWCYSFIHILHACSVLSLSDIRRRLRQEPCRDHQSALVVVPTIMNAIGPRARNSILMGSVLWLHYCGPHAPSATQGSNISSQAPAANQSPYARMPHLISHVNEWMRQWEELWGPTHNNSHGDERRYQAVVHSPSSPSHVDARSSSVQAHAGTAPGWTVPNVVIDPVLHAGGEVSESTPQPQASPALSTTSTLGGRNHGPLPSLKSSGLLDVSMDDAIGRMSGASTPTKPAAPWSLSASASPRPPLPSPGHSPGPGLSVPSPSGLNAGTPLSSLPSPGQQQLHVQTEIFPRGSPLPSPGLLAAPSSFPEGGAAAQVSRHAQEQSYFESSSPHGHGRASHGAEAPPARR